MTKHSELTPEVLDKLEAIAKAATPGPWRAMIGESSSDGTRGHGHVLTSSPPDKHWSDRVIAISHVFHERDAADWTHIAAAGPDVVLALIAAARKPPEIAPAAEPLTEQQLGQLEADIRSWWPSLYRGGGWGDDTHEDDRRAAQDRLFAAARALVTAALERAEWRADNERLRGERVETREILRAMPFEGVREAARRVDKDMTALHAEARQARAEADGRLPTGLCAKLAAELGLPKGSGADAIATEIARLRADAEATDQRLACVMDGTFSVGDGTAQKEIERLRAEVVRLRELGLEAVEMGEGQMPYPSAASRFREIRVELEHAP